MRSQPRMNRSESTTTTHCRQTSSIVSAQGLVFTASYTFSKFLSDTGGPEEWGSINGDQGGSGIRNFYDLKADWSVDGDDIPQSLVLNYVYDLPVGRGKKFGGGMNRLEDAVVGGWQVSGITTAQSGFPMSIGPGTNSQTVFGGNQHADLTGQPFKSGHCGGSNGVPVIPVGTKYCFFNPAAFTSPRCIHLRQCSSLLFQSARTQIRGRGSDVRKVVQLGGAIAPAGRLSRCSTPSTTPISVYPTPASASPPWVRVRPRRERDKCRVC